MLVGVVALLCLIFTAGWALNRRHPAAAWSLIVASALWLPANHAIEGPVLLALAKTHGVTVADLAALSGLVVGLAVLLGHAHARGTDPRQLLRLLAGGVAVFGLGALLAWLSP